MILKQENTCDLCIVVTIMNFNDLQFPAAFTVKELIPFSSMLSSKVARFNRIKTDLPRYKKRIA